MWGAAADGHSVAKLVLELEHPSVSRSSCCCHILICQRSQKFCASRENLARTSEPQLKAAVGLFPDWNKIVPKSFNLWLIGFYAAPLQKAIWRKGNNCNFSEIHHLLKEHFPIWNKERCLNTDLFKEGGNNGCHLCLAWEITKEMYHYRDKRCQDKWNGSKGEWVVSLCVSMIRRDSGSDSLCAGNAFILF